MADSSSISTRAPAAPAEVTKQVHEVRTLPSQRIYEHTRDDTRDSIRSLMRTHTQFRVTPARIVFRGSNHPWKDLSSKLRKLEQSFHPHSFSPLTVSMSLLSTFELGVLKSFITTLLSFHYPLVSASQSLSGYEPNSIASGTPDTATVVFVFDRSKIIFEEPKPFSLSLSF